MASMWYMSRQYMFHLRHLSFRHYNQRFEWKGRKVCYAPTHAPHVRTLLLAIVTKDWIAIFPGVLGNTNLYNHEMMGFYALALSHTMRLWTSSLNIFDLLSEDWQRANWIVSFSIRTWSKFQPCNSHHHRFRSSLVLKFAPIQDFERMQGKLP